MKVVFHIDELEKWEETTKNVKNLVKIAPEIDTVILLNGIAINGFLEEKHLSFIKRFLKADSYIAQTTHIFRR